MKVSVEEKKDSIGNTTYTVYFHLADGTKVGASIIHHSVLLNRKQSVHHDLNQIDMFEATLSMAVGDRRKEIWSVIT